jgi:2-hydroxy-4-carboxymuconate semialdehyde hemiacetal dehydrogenase
MNLCFIGCGSIAKSHADAFRQIEGVEFETVMGRAPEGAAAFAREHGFRHHTVRLEEALSRRVDAAVITSPSDLHAEQAEQCLRAGKDLLVEIPLATRLAPAEGVVELAGAAGRLLMVAHTQRFHPALVELRRLVQGGELAPLHAVCRWFFLRRENVNWAGRRRTWTDNLLWHHACHVVDAMLWCLGGEASEVLAQAAAPDPSLGIPLDLGLQFRLGPRRLVNVAMSYNSSWPVHEYLVIAEETTLRYEEGRLLARDRVLVDRRPVNPVLEQDREFVAAVREGRAPAASGESVLAALRVLESAEEQIGGRAGSPPASAPGLLPAGEQRWHHAG